MATPVMKSLHWLHVCFRMNFKIILVAVVWKVFFVMTPTYFSFPLSVLNCLEFLLLVLVTNHGRPDDIPVLFTIFINTSFHTYGCCSNTQLQLSPAASSTTNIPTTTIMAVRTSFLCRWGMTADATQACPSRLQRHRRPRPATVVLCATSCFMLNDRCSSVFTFMLCLEWVGTFSVYF